MVMFKMEGISSDGCMEFMPQIVKSGKELLILSMIFNQPMSGYDLIKKIYTETNVLLGQGTVYPILYLLEEEDILQAEYRTGNMRTKIYHITPQAMEIAQDKIDHFVQALNHFIMLIDPEASSHHTTNDPALNLISDLDEIELGTA